ncbi:hypothetical protein ACA910_014476 [Epithemia clementina (nom. ined.)]
MCSTPTYRIADERTNNAEQKEQTKPDVAAKGDDEAMTTISKEESDSFLDLEEGNEDQPKDNAGRAESHTRSLVKGLTWRILATTTTTVIAWIVTGQVDSALRIGLFEFFAKLLIYYLHERIWTRIHISCHF